MEDKINSNESEGAFNEFIEDKVEDMLDEIINNGDLDSGFERGSDIIIEMDDITPPTFTYGDEEDGSGGRGNGPGEGAEKIRFSIPFKKLMELLAERLGLPELNKEGQGQIKEVSYEFKTFGINGIILDKKRTFKRAIKTSIGTGIYNPEEDKYNIQFRKKDRRYKLPERIEKPKFKAVVFYMGDISYSTHGERLELEKRIINFIHSWLDYNYGERNVEHRFFVHDSEAHEVFAEDFYKVSNAGGTYAFPVFEMVSQIAFNEYDIQSTNFYAFYFGDGEVFDDDASKIKDILTNNMSDIFNRIGVVEVKPSNISHLNKVIAENLSENRTIKLSSLNEKSEIKDVIKKLFGYEKNAIS